MQNKKAQAGTVLLSGIIAVIIGVAMIPVLASLIDEAQDLQTVTVEQLTYTEFNSSQLLDNLKVSSGTFVLINGTSTTDVLRSGIEYTINERTGLVDIINRTGTFNASYNFEPATYVESSTGRTVVRQVTLMYAVAMIVLTMGAIGITIFRKS